MTFFTFFYDSGAKRKGGRGGGGGGSSSSRQPYTCVKRSKPFLPIISCRKMVELRPIFHFSDLNQKNFCILLQDLFPTSKGCQEFGLSILQEDLTEKLLYNWYSQQALPSIHNMREGNTAPPSDLSNVFMYVVYDPSFEKEAISSHPYTLILAVGGRKDKDKDETLARYSFSEAHTLIFDAQYVRYNDDDKTTTTTSLTEMINVRNLTPIIRKRSNQLMNLSDILDQLNTLSTLKFSTSTQIRHSLASYLVMYQDRIEHGNTFELGMMTETDVETLQKKNKQLMLGLFAVDDDDDDKRNTSPTANSSPLYIHNKESQSTLRFVVHTEFHDRRSGICLHDPDLIKRNILFFPTQWKLSRYQNITLHGSYSLWNPNPDCYYVFPALKTMSTSKLYGNEESRLDHCRRFISSPQTQFGTSTTAWREWCVLQHHLIQSQYHVVCKHLLEIIMKASTLNGKEAPHAIWSIRLWKELKKLYALEMEYNAKMPWFNEQSSCAYMKATNHDLCRLLPLAPYDVTRDGTPVFWSLVGGNRTSVTTTISIPVSKEQYNDTETGETFTIVNLQ